MLIVRQAVEQDLPQAAALWQDRIAVLQQMDRFCRPTPDSRAQWLELASRWLIDEQTAFLVAAVEAKVAGYMVVSIAAGMPGQAPKHFGKVLDLALELHQSHPGLGSDLLQHAQAWLQSKDIHVLVVDAPAFYPVEAAFWRAQGGQRRFVQHWLRI